MERSSESAGGQGRAGLGEEGREGTGAEGRLERGEPASDIPGAPPGCRVAPYYHTMARRLFVFGCPDKGLINGCHDSSEAASRYGEARVHKVVCTCSNTDGTLSNMSKTVCTNCLRLVCVH